MDPIPPLLAPGGALRVFAERMTSRLTSLHLDVADLSQKLRDEAISLGSRVAEMAAEIAGVTFGWVLTLFFMTMAAYVVLRRWTQMVTSAEVILPLEARHTRALFDQFQYSRQV